MNSVVKAQSTDDVVYTEDTKIPAYIDISTALSSNIRKQCEKVNTAIPNLKELLHLNSETTVEPCDTFVDIVGNRHYTYAEYYKGLKVYGRVYKLHYRGFQLISLNGNSESYKITLE